MPLRHCAGTVLLIAARTDHQRQIISKDQQREDVR